MWTRIPNVGLVPRLITPGNEVSTCDLVLRPSLVPRLYTLKPGNEANSDHI